MCLYPRLIENPKYKKNKKNKGKPPSPKDDRMRYVAIGCGQCIECRKKKVREWRLRVEWECKTNPIPGKFVTLSFSDEALDGLPKEPNAAAARAIRLFTKRWAKEFRKAPRYWVVPELGQEKTERLHMHGIMWVKNPENIERVWGYGNVKIEPVNSDTPQYVTKYTLKPDEKHEGFMGKTLCSKGIGKGFTESRDADKYKRAGVNAEQFIRAKTGEKIDIPIYYRNKLFTEETREQIWCQLLDKQVRYVRGEKIDVSTLEGVREYYRALLYRQRENVALGYPAKPWDKKKYQETRKKLDENLEN